MSKSKKKDSDLNLGEKQTTISPLEHPFEILVWEHSPVWIKGLARILTHMDVGSSIVHATINAFYIPYRNGQLFGQDVSQVEFVRMFRKELAHALVKPFPDKETTYVEELGKGAWVQMASTDVNTLMYMFENTGVEFNPVMIEHMSNVVEKDIYIIDAELQDLSSDSVDFDCRYKKRSSIVILKLKRHYELLGVRTNTGEFITNFSHNHPWILQMYQRLSDRIGLINLLN